MRPSALLYCRGRNIRDIRPEPREASTFAALLDALESDRAPSKASAGYVCGPLNGDGRRRARGVLPRRWIALDIDRVKAGRLVELRMWMSRFSACSWPTHSSTVEKPRERVFIELDREATRDECIAVGTALCRELAAEFGDDVALDPSTHRGEQPVLLPPMAVQLARHSGVPLCVNDYSGAVAPSSSTTLQKDAEGPQVASVPSVPSVPSVKPAFSQWWSSDWADWPRDVAPDGPGQRRACLFALARRLRAVDSQMSSQALAAVAGAWHASFTHIINTKEQTVTIVDLQKAYADVKVPYGSVMDEVIAAAADESIEHAGLLPDYYGETMLRLVRLCGVLQRRAGTGPIFLSARSAGTSLGLSHTEAASLLRALCSDGVLELVSKGSGNQASRYHYIWPTTGAGLAASSVPADAPPEERSVPPSRNIPPL